MYYENLTNLLCCHVKLVYYLNETLSVCILWSPCSHEFGHTWRSHLSLNFCWTNWDRFVSLSFRCDHFYKWQRYDFGHTLFCWLSQIRMFNKPTSGLSVLFISCQWFQYNALSNRGGAVGTIFPPFLWFLCFFLEHPMIDKWSHCEEGASFQPHWDIPKLKTDLNPDLSKRGKTPPQKGECVNVLLKSPVACTIKLLGS